jgi:ABC-type branched-subunit amino acid transport system ATPase component
VTVTLAEGSTQPPSRTWTSRSTSRIASFVLEKGHIRYEGTSREFRENTSIRQQYLAL